MPNGWSPSDVKLGNAGAFSGVLSNVPVSREFPITAGGSKNMVLKIAVSGVTNAGTQTLKLQSAIGADWVDSKTATFSANGNVYIKLLSAASGDQSFLPLLGKGRVVLTQSASGDAVTIDSVEVLQEL